MELKEINWGRFFLLALIMLCIVILAIAIAKMVKDSLVREVQQVPIVNPNVATFNKALNKIESRVFDLEKENAVLEDRIETLEEEVKFLKSLREVNIALEIFKAIYSKEAEVFLNQEIEEEGKGID